MGTARTYVVDEAGVDAGLIHIAIPEDRNVFIPLGQVAWWEERTETAAVLLRLVNGDTVELRFRPEPADGGQSFADFIHPLWVAKRDVTEVPA